MKQSFATKSQLAGLKPTERTEMYKSQPRYQREVGGHNIIVNRHLNQLYPFINVEKQQLQETIHGLAEDSVEENLASECQTQHFRAQDEFHTDSTSSEQ